MTAHLYKGSRPASADDPTDESKLLFTIKLNGSIKEAEMDDKIKEWIDEASYEALLRKWRFANLGDKMFSGEEGKYYSKVMLEKKDECDHVAVSKRVGWDG